MSQAAHTKALAVRFTPDEFHGLAYHARRYKMDVRAFVEYMARCYVTAYRQEEEQAKASKEQGR